MVGLQNMYCTPFFPFKRLSLVRARLDTKFYVNQYHSFFGPTVGQYSVGNPTLPSPVNHPSGTLIYRRLSD